MADWPPACAAAITGIPAERITHLAREYATTQPAAIRINYGMQRHFGGGMAMRTITCLPALAMVPDEERAAAAGALGGRGVIGRAADEEQLLAAVRAVAAGLHVFAPALARALLQDGPTDPTAPPVDLTPRESQVLALVAEVLTNKAIAQRLAISDHTVKFRVNAILGKLNAQSRTDAVVRATRQGLISL